MKHMILVASPPACGKTFIAKELARALGNAVYLDKDSVIVLSKQVFKAAHEPFNRSSDFFETYVRNYEYEAIMTIAFEALEFNDHVLINAPFARELKSPTYVRDLRRVLAERGADLSIVWVSTDPEVCHQRMLKRASESTVTPPCSTARRASERDAWKLAHWDEYIKGRDFNPPEVDGLFVIDNSSETAYREPLARFLQHLKHN